MGQCLACAIPRPPGSTATIITTKVNTTRPHQATSDPPADIRAPEGVIQFQNPPTVVVEWDILMAFKQPQQQPQWLPYRPLLI